MSLPAVGSLLDALFTWAWTTTFSAAILVALVISIQVVFRRFLTARWLYALWFCVLLRLAMPMTPPASFSVFNLARVGLPKPALEPTVDGSPAPAAGTDILPMEAQTSGAAAAGSQIGIVEPLNSAEAIPKSGDAGRKSTNGSLLRWVSWTWVVGGLGYLVLVFAHHRKLSSWLVCQPALAAPGLTALVRDAKAALGLRCSVELVETNVLHAPSLFGFFHPRLLLPRRMLQSFSDHELRLVILHELVHVKRRDVLLNWVIIFVQSIHWFNPLAWLAMKRLRSTRELVCDAMVISHLAADERQAYGTTLIKLVDGFSKLPVTPSLIPIINHKNEMHRRITMIAQLKPTSRVVTIVSAILLIALAGLTFTRARGRESLATPVAAAAEKPPTETDARQPRETDERRVAKLKEMLEEQDQLLRKKQADLDKLKQELGVTQSDEAGSANAGEPLRKLEIVRVEAKAEYQQINTLYEYVSKLNRKSFKQSVSTISPDPLLTSLLEQQASAEQKLSVLVENFANGHPDVKSAKHLLATINDQVNDRLDGILEGLKAKSESSKSRLEHLTAELEKAKAMETEASVTRRPYFQAKHEFERMREMRDLLQKRLMEEKIDAAVPRR